MFIYFLYIFRATVCPSSGEITVSMWHLVFVILCGWLSGMIMPMKNSCDTIWNWTRDLPACSAGPQQTAPPRDPDFYKIYIFFKSNKLYIASGSKWVRLLNVPPRGPLRAFPVSALDTVSPLVRQGNSCCPKASTAAMGALERPLGCSLVLWCPLWLVHPRHTCAEETAAPWRSYSAACFVSFVTFVSYLVAVILIHYSAFTLPTD